MARYCVRCGKKNGDTATECEGCGMSLGERTLPDILSRAKKMEGTIPSTPESGETTEIPIPEPPKPQMQPLEQKMLQQTHQLLENHIISEVKCEKDFLYILSDSTDFSSTEYKVMNSIGNTGLLKCKKIKYNGKEALYYLTEMYKPLEIILPTLDESRFLVILENMINQIADIKGNGFLVDIGLDVRVNRIFIDSSNGKVFLTYVPINQRCYSDIMYLERELRRDLAYIIRSTANIQSVNALRLVQLMEEPECSFATLLSAIRQNRSLSSNSGTYY